MLLPSDQRCRASFFLNERRLLAVSPVANNPEKLCWNINGSDEPQPEAMENWESELDLEGTRSLTPSYERQVNLFEPVREKTNNFGSDKV